MLLHFYIKIQYYGVLVKSYRVKLHHHVRGNFKQKFHGIQLLIDLQTSVEFSSASWSCSCCCSYHLLRFIPTLCRMFYLIFGCFSFQQEIRHHTAFRYSPMSLLVGLWIINCGQTVSFSVHFSSLLFSSIHNNPEWGILTWESPGWWQTAIKHWWGLCKFLWTFNLTDSRITSLLS